MHPHELRYADVICVGVSSLLFGGVHRGASLCSRDHAHESHLYLLPGSGCIGDSALCVSGLIPWCRD